MGPKTSGQLVFQVYIVAVNVGTKSNKLTYCNVYVESLLEFLPGISITFGEK